MGKKGLCDTCNNDKSCIFQTRLPVLQCEEFASANHKLTAAKRVKQNKGTYSKEVTVEE